MSAPIAPGAWLGLLGGGQLGRMFCMAAQALGYKVAVLDPGGDSPAGTVADRHIRAGYLDAAGLAELAGLTAAATTEFENVPAAALEFLARTARVAPTAASVACASISAPITAGRSGRRYWRCSVRNRSAVGARTKWTFVPCPDRSTRATRLPRGRAGV